MSRPHITASLLCAIVMTCFTGCQPQPAQPPQDATPEQRLGSAISSLAGDATSVTTAAADLQDVVDEIFETSTNPDDALSRIDQALASAIDSEAELRAYDDANRALGGTLLEDPADGATAKSALTMATSSACTTVIYVNGINTTWAAFKASHAKLQTLVREVLPDARVKGVYNTSATDAESSIFGGVICPVLDAGSTLLRATGVCRSAGGLLVDVSEAGSQFFNLWAVMGRDSKPGIGQATEVRNAINHEIELGRNVILVCHSQGNFFARDALRQLGTDDGSATSPFAAIGVVLVGSPEAAQYMRARFTARVDICSDWVVANLGNPGLTGCVSTSRTGCPFGNASPFCNHSFDFAYLAGDARARIRSALQTLNIQIQNSKPCGSVATDSDGDGVPNNQDGCPNDRNKTAPGNCGCSNPETPGCPPPNIVANGDFASNANGWALIAFGDSNWFSTRYGLAGWDGQPGWFFVNHTGGFIPETSQMLSGLVPGATYRVSGYFRRDTNNFPGNALRVLIDNTQMLTAAGSTSAWLPFTFTFVANDGDALLRCQSQLTGDDAYGIDHISVVRE